MTIKDAVKIIQTSECAQIATFGKDETEGFPEIRALLNLANPKHRIIWMLTTIKERIESLETLGHGVLDDEQIRAINELYQQYMKLEDTLRK